MGDRANIFFTDNENDEGCTGIYLYRHWGGRELPEELRLALRTERARRRWTDPQYLVRILVDELTKDVRDAELGAGLSTTIGDNNHPVICVDVIEQRVGYATEFTADDADAWTDVLSFEEFVDQVEANYP